MCRFDSYPTFRDIAVKNKTMPKKPPKMYMMFEPNGQRLYHTLRWTARDVKTFWTEGDLDMWNKWRDNGWRIRPVTVIVKLIPKNNKQ